MKMTVKIKSCHLVYGSFKLWQWHMFDHHYVQKHNRVLQTNFLPIRCGGFAECSGLLLLLLSEPSDILREVTASWSKRSRKSLRVRKLKWEKRRVYQTKTRTSECILIARSKQSACSGWWDYEQSVAKLQLRWRVRTVKSRHSRFHCYLPYGSNLMRRFWMNWPERTV